MIELFATAESGFELDEGQRAIPITTPENVESLSALLLDEEYFELIKKNVKSGDGINLLNTFALIPLKAKAYLDIKNRGGDSREWKKHRRDIVNLAVNFVTEETKETLTGNIRIDLEEFLRVVKTELTKDVIKGACEQDISAVEIISSLKKAFL